MPGPCKVGLGIWQRGGGGGGGVMYILSCILSWLLFRGYEGYIYIYIYTYVCVYIHVYVYICVYILGTVLQHRRFIGKWKEYDNDAESGIT